MERFAFRLENLLAHAMDQLGDIVKMSWPLGHISNPCCSRIVDGSGVLQHPLQVLETGLAQALFPDPHVYI